MGMSLNVNCPYGRYIVRILFTGCNLIDTQLCLLEDQIKFCWTAGRAVPEIIQNYSTLIKAILLKWLVS